MISPNVPTRGNSTLYHCQIRHRHVFDSSIESVTRRLRVTVQNLFEIFVRRSLYFCNWHFCWLNMYWSWWCLHVCTITAATCTSLRCIWFNANENVKIHLNQLSQRAHIYQWKALLSWNILLSIGSGSLNVLILLFFKQKIVLHFNFFICLFCAQLADRIHIVWFFSHNLQIEFSLVLRFVFVDWFFPATHRHGLNFHFCIRTIVVFFLGYSIAKQPIDKKRTWKAVQR